mmetsp:Transcript_49077/g.136918  ORF Transcript_49077/g.136918 Transcript_49077/m.136918 type:complete len:516 (+) Transcript_49077:1379-2926(+)
MEANSPSITLSCAWSSAFSEACRRAEAASFSSCMRVSSASAALWPLLCRSWLASLPCCRISSSSFASFTLSSTFSLLLVFSSSSSSRMDASVPWAISSTSSASTGPEASANCLRIWSKSALWFISVFRPSGSADRSSRGASSAFAFFETGDWLSMRLRSSLRSWSSELDLDALLSCVILDSCSPSLPTCALEASSSVSSSCARCRSFCSSAPPPNEPLILSAIPSSLIFAHSSSLSSRSFSTFISRNSCHAASVSADRSSSAAFWACTRCSCTCRSSFWALASLNSAAAPAARWACAFALSSSALWRSSLLVASSFSLRMAESSSRRVPVSNTTASYSAWLLQVASSTCSWALSRRSPASSCRRASASRSEAPPPPPPAPPATSRAPCSLAFSLRTSSISWRSFSSSSLSLGDGPGRGEPGPMDFSSSDIRLSASSCACCLSTSICRRISSISLSFSCWAFFSRSISALCSSSSRCRLMRSAAFLPFSLPIFLRVAQPRTLLWMRTAAARRLEKS